MRFRTTERPRETIDRRRFTVERFVYAIDGYEHWSIERFFEYELDAKFFMSQLREGARVIAEVDISDRPPAQECGT